MARNTKVEAFKKASAKIAFDSKHRKTIKFNISKYDAAVAKGYSRYSNLAEAKTKAAAIKRQMLASWADYLLEFEKNITANGAEVLWADNNKAAIKYIKTLVKEHQAKLLVKSKSMTTEEISLNEEVAKFGCESVETDLGEFIVQVAGEKPYHIVTPAMHKSKEDIAKLFNEKFDTDINSTPEEMTLYVRELLRKKFLTADIGVTGANFLVADVGAISVTENEGNGGMSVSFPKLHIVIAGIEKVIPKMEQLGLFYPLLAAHGTGQQITVYNSLMFGPKKEDEANGPERMVVILIDNGRTKVIKDNISAEALACIRCGACLNGCPVYKTIGGYTYDSTYSGPIGSTITPFFKGFKQYGHLSTASSLCGKCAEVCPVKVPITDILLNNRQILTKNKGFFNFERFLMNGFRTFASSRVLMNIVPPFIKNIAVTPLNFFGWGKGRVMPTFKKSFSQRHKDGKL